MDDVRRVSNHYALEFPVYEEDPDPNMLRLVAEHPLLLRAKLPRVSSQLSNGWYPLVDQLCRDIEIVLGPEDSSAFTCHQIKEKFGTLRFYWSYRNASDLNVDALDPSGAVSQFVSSAHSSARHDRIRGLVDAATSASQALCEDCGRPGKLICRGGWYLTRCSRHANPGGPSETRDD